MDRQCDFWITTSLLHQFRAIFLRCLRSACVCWLLGTESAKLVLENFHRRLVTLWTFELRPRTENHPLVYTKHKFAHHHWQSFGGCNNLVISVCVFQFIFLVFPLHVLPGIGQLAVADGLGTGCQWKRDRSGKNPL